MAANTVEVGAEERRERGGGGGDGRAVTRVGVDDLDLGVSVHMRLYMVRWW